VDSSQVDQTYELARWIFGFTALLALYDLFRRIFQETFWARAGFLLAALERTGWLATVPALVTRTITPIDFWFIDDMCSSAYLFFHISPLH